MLTRIDLGVALMPDARTREMTIKLSQALQKRHRTSYSLGDEYHPHLTLYQATFSEYDALAYVLRNLNFEGHEIRSMAIEPDGIVVVPSGYVLIKYKKPEGLRNLQLEVCRASSQSRLHDVESIWKRNNVPLDEQKARSVELYGFPEAIDNFNPHITLGRSTERINIEQVKRYLTEEAGEISTMTATELVIYELGIDAGCLNPRKI